MNVLLRLAYSQVGGAQYRRIGFNLPQQRTRQSVDNRIIGVQVNKYFNRASITTELVTIIINISISYDYYQDLMSSIGRRLAAVHRGSRWRRFDAPALSGRAAAVPARARAGNKFYLSVSYG